MADSPTQLLESIPDLARTQDAAALVALRDHADKQVRKAARKALHTLRSKGVEIPEPGATKAWSPGTEAELRGGMQSAAVIDVSSAPGGIRLMIAEPHPQGRSSLILATLTGNDRVADFSAYVQTDGQRERLIRDWDRTHSGRRVPVAWAKSRIRWARERTVEGGNTVSRSLNDMLETLGDVPEDRPVNFVAALLEAVEGASRDGGVDPILRAAGAHRWPPLFDVEPILAGVGERRPDVDESTPESEREALLLEAAKGLEDVREALTGPVSNLLEDAAAGLWLDGDDATARAVLDLARELRAADEAETLPWVARILGMQVFSTLSAMATQQGMSPEQFARALQAQAQNEREGAEASAT